MPRSIELIPLDDLVPAVVNPKRHDGDLIAASLDRFGYVEAIVRDDRTGRLVAGHGRLEDLRRRRDTDPGPPPDGVEVDKDGRWLVPVQTGWASKSDDEAHALGVALNRVGERGGWEEADLAHLLRELSEASTLDGIGFDAANLDLLLSSIADQTPTDPEVEWVGMPEFKQDDRQSQFSTTIHFMSHDDAERFWREVFGEGTIHRSAWWPRSDGFVGSNQRAAYVSDAGESSEADAPLPDLHSV